jgi:hypothetical protein
MKAAADAMLLFRMREGDEIAPDDDGRELRTIEALQGKPPAQLPTWQGTDPGPP